MTIQRFEDLKTWKEARGLVAEVYKLVQQAEDFKRNYRFRDQITAAYVSETDFQQRYARAEKVAKLISGLITYLLRGKDSNSIDRVDPTD